MNKDRVSYIVELYQKLNPDKKITQDTKIKNTSIKKLCEFEGPPYFRIQKWCEKKVSELEPKEDKNDDVVRFKEEMNKCFYLMQSRNKKYGNSWTKLRINSIVDLMLMKLDRCQKQELDNKAIEVEIEDVINYGIFCLMKIRK